MNRLFGPFTGGPGAVGLLVVRLIAGSAMMLHGLGKIQNPFGWMGPGAPVPGFLQALAALSEFGGGLAWILGLLTPLASLGIFFTMAVAALMFHIAKGDPFVPSATWKGGSWELAAVYLGISVLLMTMGPGRLSVDALLFGKRTGGAERAA